jgi:hypothetical protein
MFSKWNWAHRQSKARQIYPKKTVMPLYILWFFAINKHAACLQFLLLSLSLIGFPGCVGDLFCMSDDMRAKPNGTRDKAKRKKGTEFGIRVNAKGMHDKEGVKNRKADAMRGKEFGIRVKAKGKHNKEGGMHRIAEAMRCKEFGTRVKEHGMRGKADAMRGKEFGIGVKAKGMQGKERGMHRLEDGMLI